jgi:hypothetical protein
MQFFFSLTPAPVLPLAGLAYWAFLSLWGIVLAWLGLAIAVRKFPMLSPRARVGIAAAVLASNLLPASLHVAHWSPAYWLGLAFQSPSLTLVAVALIRFWAHKAPEAVRAAKTWQEHAGHTQIPSVLGVVLGWVLLLDTLACWPRSVYALGYGAGALWFVALGLAVAAWRWQGLAMWALCAVLLAFALSRLPSGNLWDALLDPLLWLGLHAKLLRGVWATSRAKSHAAATANPLSVL